MREFRVTGGELLRVFQNGHWVAASLNVSGASRLSSQETRLEGW